MYTDKADTEVFFSEFTVCKSDCCLKTALSTTGIDQKGANINK